MTLVKFLKETQDIATPPCDCRQSTEQIACRLPFEFVIPNSLISARSDVAPDYLNLLPTAKEGPAFHGPTSGTIYMRPMITYMLTACAVHIGSGKTYWCKQEISIMPSMAAAPPLQIEHFQHEYTVTSGTALRRHVWSRSIGKLTVSAVEPQPLNISTSAPQASATASIKLLFEPCKAQKLFARPYDWDITVKSFLRIKTFFTTQPFKQIPTQKTLESDPLIRMDSQATLADLRCCDTLPWRLHRLSSVGTIVTDASSTPWTSILTVPVNASKTFLPTFLSPLSARRYVLMLDLNIEGLSHGTLALEIPIQVIHDPSQTSDRSRRNLRGQEQETLLYQSLQGMASMSFKDGQEMDSGVPIKPPPYAKH